MNESVVLGKIIKDYMDARYIKLNKLSVGLGCSAEVAGRMLSGQRKITALEYFRICDTLEVKPSYFKDLMDSQINSSDAKRKGTN